jgi:hypothetical protein
MPSTMSGPKKRSRGHFTQTVADPALTSTLADKVRRDVAHEGGEPKKRSSRGHLTETVADPALTSTLAAKVRRDVALESAEKDPQVDDAASVAAGERPVVALGPDGDAESEDTVRVKVEADRAEWGLDGKRRE